MPTEKERREILHLYCSSCGIKSSILSKVATCTPGYVGADLALLVREVNRIRDKNKHLYS